MKKLMPFIAISAVPEHNGDHHDHGAVAVVVSGGVCKCMFVGQEVREISCRREVSAI
jgi:hypothetical protein